MNINLSIVVVAVPLALGLAGCGGSSKVKPESKASLAVTPLAPAANLAYVSARNTPSPAPEKCPNNSFGWKKEPLPKLLSYAEACARNGKQERLEQVADFVAQKFHQTPWGPFYLAVSAEQRKEYPRALWMIDLALKKSPKTALLHYQKGRIHWALGEYRPAVEAYRIAARENPKFVDAHLLLAQLHFRDQDYKEAATHFKQVVELEPANATAAASLGETYMALGDSTQAIEMYERAVQAAPRVVSHRLRLAGLYETSRKDYAQALVVYKRLKTLLSEQRAPAEEIPLDLNEKIRRLEDSVNKTQADAKKVTGAPAEKTDKKVKK